ncbi:MAG: TraM recognition domain-containing protein, partial [Bacillota bacterium]
VEPKGDVVREVEAYAGSKGVPVLVIDPGDPNTPRFNPLQGDPLIVAEVTRTVLKSMFGRQEAFFSHVQETSAHNTVLLLKYLEAHDREVALAEGREPPCLTMQDLVRVLRNPEQLKARVDALRRLDPGSDIVEYFDREALGPTGAKLHEFAMGLRMQLEDIAGSPQLRHVFGGPSDVDLDAHLRGGAVLCVNTCMGLLGRKGDLFGQFFIMHFQQAVFRRPPGERPPHFLYLDEFARYLNPDFERMVAMARSYRCGLTLALQVTDQLLLAEAPAFREVIIQNCRNRLVFGGLSASDAERFAREFGEVLVRQREHTFRRHGTVMGWWPDMYRESERSRPAFDPTRLKHLPRWHVVYQVVRDGVVQVSRQGVSLPRPRLRRPAPAAPAASGA